MEDEMVDFFNDICLSDWFCTVSFILMAILSFAWSYYQKRKKEEVARNAAHNSTGSLQ
jgi:hypothetical protein